MIGVAYKLFTQIMIIMQKKIILYISILSSIILSCKQETPVVKHQSMKSSPSGQLKGVKVFNTIDPICHMEVEGFLQDTILYQTKTYGFCSTYCKDEFKKNPEQYVEK